MVSAELNAEEVLGAGPWVKVSAGCLRPGGHEGLSKMPHGDFSTVLWVRMAQNISSITFAAGFLFKQVSSGEMQRGNVNHILLGSPKAFLALAPFGPLSQLPCETVLLWWGNIVHEPCCSSRNSGQQSLGQQHTFRASTPALLRAWFCSHWSLP